MKNTFDLLYRYLLLIFLVVVIIQSITLKHGEYKKLIWADAEGYYMYLPAIFINHGFEGLHINARVQYSTFEDTDKVYTKFTYGVALMQLPFFLIVHLIAILFGLEATGYSPIYGMGMAMAGAFYLLAGLFFLKRTLEHHFPRWVVLLTLIGTFAGTNLYHYSISQPGMSHVFSFFLFAVFIYFTPKFLERPNNRRAIFIGLIGSFIVLVRPTNIIIVLYLFLYDIYSLQDLRHRIKWFAERYKMILLMMLMIIPVFIPQMTYWKYMSGSLIFYSYREEGFDFLLNPKVMEVLFFPRNGLFIYTPMAFFAVIGLIIGTFRRKFGSLGSLLIFIIATYLFSSWWTWWFGGGFGHRCYVEFYTLLSFGLALVIRSTFDLSRNKLIPIVPILLFGILIFANIKLTILYNEDPWLFHDKRIDWVKLNRILNMIYLK